VRGVKEDECIFSCPASIVLSCEQVRLQRRQGTQPPAPAVALDYAPRLERPARDRSGTASTAA